MKKLIIILLLLTYDSLSQSLSVFDIDTSSFPTIKAKFYAFDVSGNQILNLNTSDFEVTEDGVKRNVTYVSCPAPKPPQPISSVLTIDVSGSMSGTGIGYAKEAAKAWVQALPLGQSECAITSFNSNNFFNQDFTTNRNRLLNRIEELTTNDGTDFNAALINPMSGGLLAVEKGKYKRVVILLTDGYASGNESAIIQKANQINATVFCVTLGTSCPPILRNVSEQTGGQWFENITTAEQAREVYLKILNIVQGGEPCEIEWKSGFSCIVGMRNVEIKLNNTIIKANYTTPFNGLAKLEFEPTYVYFMNKEPGKNHDTTVKVTARGVDFYVSDIVSSNIDFQLTPKNFTLKPGDSKNLTLSFTPTDSGYTYTTFEFLSDVCSIKYYASGGFLGVKPKIQTLKLIHPTGGEKFVVGSDTMITWKGIPPTDTVSLEYSLDNGVNWQMITAHTTNLTYKWENIPFPESQECLVKITQVQKISEDTVITLNGHNNLVSSISWHPDGIKIVSGSWDKTIKIWNSITETEISSLSGHSDIVRCVQWSPDGTKIASGSNDGTIKIWDANTGIVLRTLIGNNRNVLSVAWSPDSRKIASGNLDKTIKIWDVQSGTELRTLSGYFEGVYGISWSPDGTKIVSGNWGWDDMRICDVQTGDEIKILLGDGYSSILTVDWSQDGSKIVAGGASSIIRIYDWFSGLEIQKISHGSSIGLLSIDWSPCETMVLAGSADNQAIIWDIKKNIILKKLIGHRHHFNIFSVCWNPKYNVVATGGSDSTIKIWNLEENIFQEDISDSVFSIVAPQSASHDIEMDKVIINQQKDSVISNFISNIGSWKFRIDSIYFRGADALAFSLLAGFPKYEVDAGKSNFAEFRFAPTEVRNYQAEIVIITQSDTLIQNIYGEGVKEDIAVFGNIIDFGIREIANYKDTTMVLITNNSSNPVDISSIIMLGPDKEQFEFLNGNVTPLILNSGESHTMTMRFNPKYIGRTSGQIGFFHNTAGSPSTVQLFGAGIGAQISASFDSAYAGEIIDANIKLESGNLSKFAELIGSFDGVFRVEHSILAPINKNDLANVQNDSVFIKFSGNVNPKSSTLATLKLKAGLGRVEETSIDFENINWYDTDGNLLDYDTEFSSGHFKLLGICREGGIRLVNPNTQAGMMTIAPNPAENKLDISLSLTEKGQTEICIYNVLGEVVQTLFFEDVVQFNTREINTDLNGLSTGQYLIILRTPTYIESSRLMIINRLTMKKLIIILLLIAYDLSGQSLSVFDIDTSSFPTIKAKFYAFDASGNQILNLSPSDFEVTEDGVKRNVTNISCPSPKPPVPISSVLTIDISGSMTGSGIGYAKDAAKAWVQALPLGQSECAITSFNSNNFFNQDFTTNRNRLLNRIEELATNDGTDFNAALINPMSGGLLAVEKGKYKRVVILLTDGYASGNETAIIQKANQINATIFCVTVGTLCPPILRNVSEQTGGQWFENITTAEQAREVYLKILNIVQGGEPCEIEWKSGFSCIVGMRNVEIKLNNTIIKANYTTPFNGLAKLEFEPTYVYFMNKEPGKNHDTTIKVKARGLDFDISDILSSNIDFQLTPKNFTLKAGESKNLTLSFTPTDSGYTYTELDFVNDNCPKEFFAKGGFPGIRPKIQTLKITHPNGEENFIIGSDTVITWEGISKLDTVSLDLSIDNGKSWKNITPATSRLIYKWEKIPKPSSNDCLIKVKQNSGSNIKDALNDFLWSTIPEDYINSLAYSPNGSIIAYGSYDNTIKIRDADTGVLLRTLTGHSDVVGSVAFSPDGSKLASGSWDNTIKLWDADTGVLLRTFTGHNDAIRSLSFSPNGSILTSGSHDGTIKVWNVNTGTLVRTLNGHSGWVMSVLFNPDGSLLASGSFDKTIKLWDANTGTLKRTITGHSDFVGSVAFSPDGSMLVSGSKDKTLKLWETNTGLLIRTLTGHNDAVITVAYCPDSSMIASGSDDNTLKIWNANNGTLINTLTGHSDAIRSVAYKHDGSTIASGSWDGSINLWDSNTGTLIRTLTEHSDDVASVAFNPNGSIIASGSQDNTIKLWDAKTGALIRSLIGHSYDVNSIAFSPDGSMLASGSQDRTIKLWNPLTGDLLRTLTGDNTNVYSIAFSPDGSKIATGGLEGTINLLDVNTGALIRTFLGNNKFVESVAFSPDGSILASGGDNAINLWDVNTGALLRTIYGHSLSIFCVAFNPDGTKLASGSFDHTVKLWDSKTGALIRTFTGNNGNASSVAFCPDGSMIASGSDYKIKLWDVKTGNLLRTFTGHSNNVNSVAFSPDGLIIASGSEDKTVKVWLFEEAPLQQDISDSVFSIVAPQASSHDIDLGKVLVNSVKDSVVYNFISNIGSWKFRVDSIYFRGADASAFSLLAGFPKYELEAGKSNFAEIRFAPAQVRNYQAEIVIITQADTLIQNIIGEGVKEEIAVFGNIIDFGIREIANYKDTTMVLITNNSSNPVDISSIIMLGPDKEQFEFVNGNVTPLTLNSGESHTMTVRFNPKYIGRTSGQIGFFHNAAGSPSTVQLFGAGIGAQISASFDSAFAGEIIEANIKLESGNLNKFAELIGSFDGVFRVENSILAPVNKSDLAKTKNDSAYIKFSGNVNPNNSTLATLKLKAGLGRVEETSIDFENINWYDTDGKLLDYDTEFSSGHFKLLGICREGGTRLVNPNAQAGMMTIAPNPAENKLDISLLLTEKGQTEICIYNVLGEVVHTLFSEDVVQYNTREISTDLSGLSTGQYLIILRTPTYIESSRLMIIK